ncbi:PREDICTED: translocator protein [Wasmannia auropunctata]|uniref:translocator protein n=1 Tax=Wasmannia auropunctata TaxID=64793 RepID=UPI0005EDF697|nr:PREDICTED: translocator protein [Wasmannia auropunctata]XP_011694947.1 PREDICTED: translocator protein [Wasmannia auropunctata]XP_011694948.1 PREDICTED: translocator protein [Wasmannia auropunctata]
MPVKMNWPMLMATISPNVGGWIGGFITRKNINWYETLKKPKFIPPNWVFAPVWTTLYCTMGYSSYLVWRDGGGFEGAAVPLSVYGLNLALNWSWTPLFFGARNIKWALYEIAALWVSTAAVGVVFYHVSPAAGYLIIPYVVWNSFAAAFNYFIYRDNKQLPAVEKAEGKKH